MKYSQLITSIVASAKAGDRTPTYITGAPGGGKTALCMDVAAELGIPKDVAKTCMFRPSLHDPVDLLGVPYVDQESNTTRWAPNHFLHHVNEVAERYGFAVLTWDELAQAVPMMQNAIAGSLLDRSVGELELHPNVIQVATGNRQTDKAGANRILTQLGNRLEHCELDTDLDDWVNWALDTGIDPLIIGYIRFKPDALHDFDPNRMTNATPRSWEAAARVPTDLPTDIYHAKLAGRVGEGRAAEYVGFRQTYAQLPSREDILLNPTKVPLPEEPSARYAAVTMATAITTKDNLDMVTQYVDRFTHELHAPEFAVVYYRDVARTKPECKLTKTFIKWASSDGAAVFL